MQLENNLRNTTSGKHRVLGLKQGCKRESSKVRRGEGGGFSWGFKEFYRRGGEEIAGWTLRVSKYFYYPHSSSLSVQSGVLASSKKCFPCHSFPKEMSRQVRTNNRLFGHLDYCAR